MISRIGAQRSFLLPLECLVFTGCDVVETEGVGGVRSTNGSVLDGSRL